MWAIALYERLKLSEYHRIIVSNAIQSNEGTFQIKHFCDSIASDTKLLNEKTPSVDP